MPEMRLRLALMRLVFQACVVGSASLLTVLGASADSPAWSLQDLSVGRPMLATWAERMAAESAAFVPSRDGLRRRADRGLHICARRPQGRILRGARGGILMQSDTIDRPSDGGDDDDRARIEEERMRLARMFGRSVDAPVDSADSDDPPPGPDAERIFDGLDPVLSDLEDSIAGAQGSPDPPAVDSQDDESDTEGDTAPSTDANAIARLNRLLAQGGRSESVVRDERTDAVAFAKDVDIQEARRRLADEVQARGAGRNDAGMGQENDGRGSAPESYMVAESMEQGMAQSHAAIICAALSGTLGLTVRVNMPELDPSSRGYNETALYSWSSSIATSMATLVSSGAAIKVIVQDDQAAASLSLVLREVDATEQLVRQGRLIIRTLSQAIRGEEIVSGEDAGVLLVAPTNSAASKVTKQVRQVLVQHRGKLTVVLNPCLDTPGADGKPVGLAPVELARFEEVYHVTAWALQGKVQRRHVPKDGGSPEPPKPPRPRRVVLTRSFPGLWALSVFVDDDQRYELVHTMEKKPSDKLVLQLCARLLSPETSA